MIRRLLPQLLLPLAILAGVLATVPWLRAFPTNVGSVPLLGAAALSVLVPLLSLRLGMRLWVGLIVDAVVLVAYLLFVVLHDPTGFGQIVTGLYRGPSQILTFALPLVSPRNLMVAPTVVVWVAGALAGECLVRRWATLLPYVGLLVSFGLAYAGTQRAATGSQNSIQLRETLLAGGLLLTLLLMRAAQSWVREDESAESTQADGILPLRGFGIGVLTAALVAGAAALAVQSSAFPKGATKPERPPIINESQPLAPLQFVAGLRPQNSGKDSTKLFDVALDKSAPGYFGIANLDLYDGAGWSFDRTFRPSGGVLPDDSVAGLTGATEVTQRYSIEQGALTSAPWIPTLYRAQRVTGAAVDIDAGSGMIVPAAALPNGTQYNVVSRVAPTTFANLDAHRSTPDTSTSAIDLQVPATLRTTLDRLIISFTAETGVASQPALPFLRALQRDFQGNYSLSGAARGSAIGTLTPEPSSSSASASKSASSARSSTSAKRSGDAAAERVLAAPKPTHRSTPRSTPRSRPGSTPRTGSGSSPATSSSASPSPSPSDNTADLAGGTGFADVVASVLGQQRSGTPEQFATLVALVARELGVPARVVTGFRMLRGDSSQLPAGAYTLRTEHAWTWAEVPIIGKGWIALDATPGLYSDRTHVPESGASASPSQSSTPSRAQITQRSSGGQAVAKPVTPPVETASTSKHGLVVALVLAIAALAFVIVLLLASRKSRRRARRRRAPDPRTKLLGAWQEHLDMLTESGLPELTTMTSKEIAELTQEQFGPGAGERTALLGRAANSVAYSAVTTVDGREVSEAWSTQRTLRRIVHKQLTPAARVAAAVRYHRPKRARTVPNPPSWAAEAAARASSADGSTRRRIARRYQGRRRR